MSCMPKLDTAIASIGALLFCVALSGCTTALSGAWPARGSGSVSPPASAPKIIVGQKAYINGYTQDIAVWRETGLFSSVEPTSSFVPPLKGVLIVRKCSSYKSQTSGFLGAMFITFSLGLVPDVDWYDVSCEMEFYQNGKKVGGTSLTYNEKYFTGWAFLIFDSDKEKWWKEESRMCSNKLLRTL